MHVQCTCLFCGGVFLARARSVRIGEGRFCSNGCRDESRKTQVLVVCEQCGASFRAKPANLRRGKGRYCRAICRTLARRVSLAERFRRRIDTNGPIPAHRPELGPCWIWQGSRFPSGYGALTTPIKTYRTHRYAWEIEHGPIPAGMLVCHHCDNRPCVRPDHLFLGTTADNAADRESKGRGNPGHGIAQPSAKVTDDDVREIRRLASTGMMQKEIGRRFGIAQPTVSGIVRRVTWAHIE